MSLKKSCLWSLFVFLTTAVSGCVVVDYLEHKLGVNQGVPLSRFEATEGRYFPQLIENFFPKVIEFYKDYPTKSLAREDVRLIQVKKLTEGNHRHNEANLSWSADGVYLGYEIVTDKTREILVKDLAGNYSRRLSMQQRRKDNFLQGLLRRNLVSFNAGLRWSRDSTRYAFMSNGGTGEYNIYVGAVGRSDEMIAQSPTKDGFATWNPKYHEIAFVSSRSGRGDIYGVSLIGNRLVRLSSSEEADLFPEWFPDGHGIVYASGDALNHDLKVLLRDSNSRRWKKPYKLTNWSQDDLKPSVSPDGKYIAFYANSMEPGPGGHIQWNLHIVPFIPGKSYGASELRNTVVAKNVVIDINTGPAWTPDSRKIIYIAQDPERFNPIYCYDLYSGKRYHLNTKTRMNRDVMISKLGVISFRAQVGVWDRVFLALTNQGMQIQDGGEKVGNIHYTEL